MMDGKEVQYTQEGFEWVAKEGDKEGRGHNKEEATANLTKAKLETPVKVVSDLTIENSLKAKSQFEAQTIKLIVKELKNKTPDGMTFVAFYDDAPDLQGYGISGNAAKLDLFKKQKENEKK